MHSSNKKQIKLTQIAFKKGKQSKARVNKNFSELSTASNKASREMVLKSFISNDSRKTKQSGKAKQDSKYKQRGTLHPQENLGIIKEERKKVKRRISNSQTLSKEKNIKQSANSGHKYNNNTTITKDGFLAAKVHAESCSRPSICSIVSDETINREMIFGDHIPSSTKELSSRSGARYNNTEEHSENKRYDSNTSMEHSPSSINDLEENKELQRMLHQSYVRRSTEFEGKTTPNMTDNKSKRRPSSAKSRESFFIPYIFKKGRVLKF